MGEIGGARCPPEKGDYPQVVDVDFILLSGGRSFIRALDGSVYGVFLT